MFKIQIQWMREGEWLPTVWPPLSYAEAFFKWRDLKDQNPEHLYKLVSTGSSR